MPDPRACCLLEICCSPPRAVVALAGELEALDTTESVSDSYEAMASGLLSKYRLIPRDLEAETLEKLDASLRGYLEARGLETE